MRATRQGMNAFVTSLQCEDANLPAGWIPFSRRDIVLLHGGEGGAQRRMRVRAKPRAAQRTRDFVNTSAG
ncbi:hypothetical protein A7D16_06300 [Xanthomonas nasturtii]|nr:hypothetical protein A7D16_06300 [Xanthomonas nasturtii]